jgi:hypothetical protein
LNSVGLTSISFSLSHLNTMHPPASRSLPVDGNMAHPPHPSHPRRRPWILPHGTESEMHRRRPRTAHNPRRRPLLHPFCVIELCRSCGRILHLTASPPMQSSAAATRTASSSRPPPYSTSRGTAAAAAAPQGGREEAGCGWWHLTPPTPAAVLGSLRARPPVAQVARGTRGRRERTTHAHDGAR